MKIPEYYKGKKYGYEARKVVEEFQPSNYNLGTALTYIMRAGKKPGNPIEQDIRKAIHHLQFELDRQQKAEDILKNWSDAQTRNEGAESVSTEDTAAHDNEGKTKYEDLQEKFRTQKVEVMKGVWVETRTNEI
jgi:hypothetical protein